MHAVLQRKAGMGKQKDGGLTTEISALLFSLAFHLVVAACSTWLPAGQGHRCE